MWKALHWILWKWNKKSFFFLIIKIKCILFRILWKYSNTADKLKELYSEHSYTHHLDSVISDLLYHISIFLFVNLPFYFLMHVKVSCKYPYASLLNTPFTMYIISKNSMCVYFLKKFALVKYCSMSSDIYITYNANLHQCRE